MSSRARIHWAVPAVCLVTALIAVPHTANGQDAQTTQTPSARTLFERGLRALEANRYAEAALALEASCRIRRVPVALYNLGLAYRGIGRYHAAIEAFEGYLDEPSSAQDATQQALVRQEITDLRRSLAALRVTTEPPEARVHVDGRAARPEHGEIETDPGDHMLEVSAEGYRTFREELTLEPGATVRREIQLEALAPRAPSAAAPEASASGGRRTLWGPGAWVGAGIAVASGITALGFWIDGSILASGYNSRCRTYPPAPNCTSEYNSTQSTLDTRAAAVNIAWGVAVLGVVVLAVDVVAGLLADDPPTTRRVSAAIDPSHAGVLLRW